MDINKIENLVAEIEKQIENIDKNLLLDYPVADYIRLINKTKKYTPYKNINPAIEPVSKAILKRGDAFLLGLYHKLILLHLIRDANSRLKNNYMPERLVPIYDKYFERLIARFGSETALATANYYQFSNDKFIKDVGVCRFSLLLAGPVLLDVGYMPLKYLLRKSTKAFIKGLGLVLKYNSLAPVLKMHTHITNPVVMSNFTEEGWINFYKAIAEMMIQGRNYKGIYCAGWFFDPALQKISPEMAYICELVKATGGELFYLGTDTKIIKDAVFLNRNRKQQYEAGIYKPCRYVIFIPRKKLLAWYGLNKE